MRRGTSGLQVLARAADVGSPVRSPHPHVLHPPPVLAASPRPSPPSSRPSSSLACPPPPSPSPSAFPMPLTPWAPRTGDRRTAQRSFRLPQRGVIPLSSFLAAISSPSSLIFLPFLIFSFFFFFSSSSPLCTLLSSCSNPLLPPLPPSTYIHHRPLSRQLTSRDPVVATVLRNVGVTIGPFTLLCTLTLKLAGQSSSQHRTPTSRPVRRRVDAAGWVITLPPLVGPPARHRHLGRLRSLLRFPGDQPARHPRPLIRGPRHAQTVIVFNATDFSAHPGPAHRELLNAATRQLNGAPLSEP